MEISERVKKYIEDNNLILPGDNIIAGVSGGADSLCMYYNLVEYSKAVSFNLTVVCVNHGLRLEAADEVEYVRTICMSDGVEFVSENADVKGYAVKNGYSEEEAGRILRYEIFNAVGTGKGNYKIAVAHHKDDLAETVLFNLFRGSGPEGLIGIKPIRDNIIHPILCLLRKETERYLNERSIKYCIDKSNLENVYSRNRIRNFILPEAEKITRGAAEHIAEASAMLYEEREYLNAHIDSEYEEVKIEDGLLSCELLGRKSHYVACSIIRKELLSVTPHLKDITRQHVEDIYSLLHKEGSKEVMLPYNITVRKEYDRLSFHTDDDNSFEEYLFDIQIPGECRIDGVGMFKFRKEKADVIIPNGVDGIKENRYTKLFDYDKIGKSVCVRNRRTGDYLTVTDEGQTKKLKDYMINEKIPKAEREKIPLVAVDNHIAWIVGYRISSEFKVTKETKYILEVSFLEEKNGREN